MKILLGFPAYRGHVHALHLAQVANLMAAGGKYGHGFAVTYADSCSVDWSRNMLIHMAMRGGCDWMLMCDADTVYPGGPDNRDPGSEILRMLHDGARLQAAVIAAPVPMRGRPGKPLNVARITEDGKEENPPAEEIYGRVQAVDRIGTGFFAVNMRWLSAFWSEKECAETKAPWFNGHQRWVMPENRPGWEGEDYKFCDGVRKREGQVYCDGRIQPWHIDRAPEQAALVQIGALVEGE